MPRRDPQHAGLIEAVEPGSLAEEAGLRPGDRVLEINERPIRDQLDFRFHATEETVELHVIHDGDDGYVEFTKAPDEPLGIEFADGAFDGTELCNNRCFFCFLKGLPKGLRRTLYVKDDDYRLSFLHGNFVTLTNLTEEDWERLAEQRLSPLNVSVHATEPALRRELLGNQRAPDIREQNQRLEAIGIAVNAQVVLCPGVNDGSALDRTLGDLLAAANVRSIAVVPVGASLDAEDRIRHPGMRACTREEARAVLRQLRRWQRTAQTERGASIVHAGDEFYLTAELRIPAAARYEGFPQWENGIGMTRTLMDDWTRLKRRHKRRPLPPPVLRHVTIGCGTLIAPTLARLAAEAEPLFGVRVNVVPVRNSLFGERVNVSGLLPGQAFIDQLRAAPLGERVFLPRASLDYFGRHFLDDVTPDAVADALHRPIAFAYTLSEVIEWAIAPEGETPERTKAVSPAGRAWSVAG